MPQTIGHTYSTKAMGQELRQFLRLGTPILIAEALHMSASFVDTVMAGRYSSADLAAVAVGSSILFPVMILMIGILMATTPTVSQYFGSKRLKLIGPFVQQSLWLAALLSILAVALLYTIDPLFDLLDIEDPIKSIGLGYLHATAWSLPAMALMQSLRSFSEGLGITKPLMYFSLLGLIINIPMNYIFINGHFGVPEMGGVGCGWATTISMWISVIGMACYVYAKPVYHQCAMFKRFDWPKLTTQLTILKVGLPIGFSIFIEATMFAIVALLLAPLGADIVAAHQLVLNFTSLCFIIPLSIGMAMTIRVGHGIGGNLPNQVKRSVLVGFGLALGLSSLTCLTMLMLPLTLAGIYTTEPVVVEIAASLFIFAALFQLSDAVQIAANGALRGFKDTAKPLLLIFISYWLTGLPLGYVLGMTDIIYPAMGPAGFWIGIIFGLSVAAVLLSLRLWRVLRKPLPVAT
ncbi:MATE family efflux transporter [Oceanospirillaceae bacterium]|nr:MATE family efflux transporter [Oceanospirillaceae bacterium]